MASVKPQQSGARWVPLTLLQQSSSRSPLGGQTNVFNPVGTLWAIVAAVGGREQYAAQQINPDVNYKLTVRYGDVQAYLENDTLALLWAQDEFGKYYDILAPLVQDQRRQFVDLLCIVRAGRAPGAQ